MHSGCPSRIAFVNVCYPYASVLEFPAVGNRNTNGGLNNAGTNGNYWSATQNSNATNAYNLNFNSSSVNATNNNNKTTGLSVRCVRREFTTPKNNQGCGEGRKVSLERTTIRECPVNSADYWEGQKPLSRKNGRAIRDKI